jgi:hypothetical protein
MALTKLRSHKSCVTPKSVPEQALILALQWLAWIRRSLQTHILPGNSIILSLQGFLENRDPCKPPKY